MATNKIQAKAHIGGTNGGAALKYLGQTRTTNQSNDTTIQLTYQSTKEKLLQEINNLHIGGKDDDLSAYLSNIELKQDSGPFWNAVLTYTSNDPFSIIINVGTASTPTNYTCTTVMKSLALQTSQNYQYIWNHILIYLDTDNYNFATDVGDIHQWNSSNYKTPINASNGHLKWCKDASEMPTDPVYQDETPAGSSEAVPTPHYWKIAYECTKPGVEYYEFPTYEITQSSRSRGEPTWWKQNLPGKVLTPQQMRKTFGINTGEWLCHGGQIRYDGKAYDASCTYQWTPDEWDRDLYDEAEINNGGNPILP